MRFKLITTKNIYFTGSFRYLQAPILLQKAQPQKGNIIMFCLISIKVLLAHAINVA